MKILLFLFSIPIILCFNISINNNGTINFTDNDKLKNLKINLFIQGIVLKTDDKNITNNITLSYNYSKNFSVSKSNENIKIDNQSYNWIIFYSNKENESSYFGLGRWNDNSNINVDGRIIKQFKPETNNPQSFTFHFQNETTTLVLKKTVKENFNSFCIILNDYLPLWGCKFYKIYIEDFNKIKNNNKQNQRIYYQNYTINQDIYVFFSYEEESIIYLNEGLKKNLNISKDNKTNITLVNEFYLIHIPGLNCKEQKTNDKNIIIINKEIMKKFIYMSFNEDDDKIYFDNNSNLFLDIYEYTPEYDITIKYLFLEIVLILLILIGIIFIIIKNKENFEYKQFLSLNESYE